MRELLLESYFKYDNLLMNQIGAYIIRYLEMKTYDSFFLSVRCNV